MARRLVMRDRCRLAYQQVGMQFISGKWFEKDGTEVRNIDKWLYRLNLVDNATDLNQFKNTYTQMYGEEDGIWPEMQIVREARATMAQKSDLCYPLNTKQLIIINYLLRHDEEICFILTGIGGSGKSTFGNIICEIFGKDNTAPLNMSDIGNQFMLATAADKRLIYSTEINSDKLNNGRLKQLFSNEPITYNPKGLAPFRARCQSAFFFNCNIPPRINLCDTGMLRRILYYAMNNRITNPDPTLNKREWSHEDLVNVVRHALSVDMTDWQQNFQAETRYYLLRDNSVFMYYDVGNYDVYCTRCCNDGLTHFNKPHWDEIRKLIEEWGGRENVIRAFQQESNQC